MCELILRRTYDDRHNQGCCYRRTATLPRGLIGALTSTFKKRTIEQASNGSEGIRVSHRLDPHIVLLGIANQNEAVETIAKISEKCRSTKVIYLSTPGNEVVVQEVLRAGARGCVSKVVSGVEIVRCIQAVLLGESYVSPSLAAQLLTRSSQRNSVNRRDDIFANLTTREHKIMQSVALGLTNKEIAQKLVLSDNTIKCYMTQIMQKLHVRNRLEAVLQLRTWSASESEKGD